MSGEFKTRKLVYLLIGLLTLMGSVSWGDVVTEPYHEDASGKEHQSRE